MPTQTTDYTLVKPLNTENYDVSVQNGNMDKIDTALGVTICTSSTRPASPKNRQAIYETDTGVMYVWRTDLNPDAWYRLSVGAVGGKRYGLSNTTLTTLVSNTTEQLTGMDTGAVFLDGSRLYKVSAMVEYDSTVVNDRFRFRIRSDNTSGLQWAERVGAVYVSNLVRQQEYIEGLFLTDPTPGNRTLVLTAQRVVGTGQCRIYKSNTTWPHMKIELLGQPSILTEV